MRLFAALLTQLVREDHIFEIPCCNPETRFEPIYDQFDDDNVDRRPFHRLETVLVIPLQLEEAAD